MTTTPDGIEVLSLRLPFRMGRVNSYLINTLSGHVLVDTGPSNARRELLGRLERAGCTPASLRLVLLTHGDFDHIGNAAFLRSGFGARLALHPDDIGMAERGEMFANRRRPSALVRSLLPIFAGFGPSERFSPDVPLGGGLDLAPFGIEATVLHLPGHSKGSIGILTSDGALFCGDLLENLMRPKLNSLMDDHGAAMASLAKLGSLEIRMVYPGHGRPFQLERLAEVSPSPVIPARPLRRDSDETRDRIPAVQSRNT